MTFQALYANVTDLRNSLRVYVGENALPEISVRPPANNDDEASFLRLVGWSYALIFEAGRVTFPFLIRLPGGDSPAWVDPSEARQLVHSLRTWISHNLGLSDHDVAVSREAMGWLRRICGTDSPATAEEWSTCFGGLCLEVDGIVTYCKSVVNLVLTSPDDGESTISDLTRRLDRYWPPHEFDKIVTDVCYRLGERLDVPKFRAPRLQDWRQYLESVADADDIENQMVRRIERDILDHFNNLLPIDGRDVMEVLGIEPSPEVRMALNYARQLWESGIRDKEELLRCLLHERSRFREEDI